MRKFLLLFSLLIAFTLNTNAQMAKGCKKFLGNITTSYNWQEYCDFQDCKGFVYSDYWNQVTCENATKWGSVHSGWGKFDWTNADRTYNYCKEKGILFKFHALIWGSQYPSWIKSLSVADTKTAIIEWFNAVQKHYPDLEIIDVVNEAIYAEGYHSPYNETKIIQALTELANERLGTNYSPNTNGYKDVNDYQWIAEAFRLARDRWPNAILIYNDFNTFNWQKSQFITLVNALQELKAPIDAAGNQSHDLNDMSGSAFKTALYDIYNQTHLPQYITEYDIAHSDDNTFLTRYSEQFPVMWEADFVPGVTLWGWEYGKTWTKDGNSGLVRNCEKRSAFDWLENYMKSPAAQNAKSPDMTKSGIVADITVTSKTVEIGTDVTIKVKASSTKGEITSIEYLIDETVINKGETFQAGFTIPGKYDITILIKDNLGNSYSTDVEITVCDKKAPYNNGQPLPLPGILEAENYDEGCEGTSFYDSDGDGNSGCEYRADGRVDIVKAGNGKAIGYTAKGEWLEYTVNFTKGGQYDIFATVASGNDGSSFSLTIDNNVINFKVPNGGDWDTYTEVKGAAEIESGEKVIRLDITGDYANVDKLEFICEGTNAPSISVKDEILPLEIYNLLGQKQDPDKLTTGIYIQKVMRNGRIETHKIVITE